MMLYYLSNKVGPQNMAFYIQPNSPFILFSWCASHSFVLIDTVINSQISVPLTILVLAVELCSLFIHSFIGSFIPQTHMDVCTVSSGLESAHTGQQVPNVHISSELCHQWCQVGSLRLAWWEWLYIPRETTIATHKGFCFPPESWDIRTPLSEPVHAFICFTHSICTYPSTDLVWPHKISIPSSLPHSHLTRRSSPCPSSPNWSWKLMKNFPSGLFLLHFHCTSCFSSIVSLIPLRYKFFLQ